MKEKASGHILYAVGEQLGLVILGPIALFSKLRLINKSGKEEGIENAATVCPMYRPKKRGEDNDDFRFHRHAEAREQHLIEMKTTKRSHQF